MLRAFSTHRIRPIEELEGLWEFEPLGADDGIPDHYRYRLPVSGVWEMHPAFLTDRGRGVYRRTVAISPVPSTRLEAVRFTPGRQESTWWGAIRVAVRAIRGPRDPIVTVDLVGARVELHRESTDGEVAWYGGLAAFPGAPGVVAGPPAPISADGGTKVEGGGGRL